MELTIHKNFCITVSLNHVFYFKNRIHGIDHSHIHFCFPFLCRCGRVKSNRALLNMQVSSQTDHDVCSSEVSEHLLLDVIEAPEETASDPNDFTIL